MKVRDCGTNSADQGRTCHQRIPTVRPLRAKLVDRIEQHSAEIILIILLAVLLANLG